MLLETVKVQSQNENLRGKDFDVYYLLDGEHINTSNIMLIAVEEVTGATDLKDIINQQSRDDIKASLCNKLQMRKLQSQRHLITDENIVKQAQDNSLKGFSND